MATFTSPVCLSWYPIYYGSTCQLLIFFSIPLWCKMEPMPLSCHPDDSWVCYPLPYHGSQNTYTIKTILTSSKYQRTEVLESQDHKCLLQALCLKKIMRPLNKQHIYFTFQLPQYLCQSAWISAAVPTVLLGPMFAKEADDER